MQSLRLEEATPLVQLNSVLGDAQICAVKHGRFLGNRQIFAALPGRWRLIDKITALHQHGGQQRAAYGNEAAGQADMR